jgi:FAD/FMN-containing dehydrogenase
MAACHTAGKSPGGTLQRQSFNAKSDYVSTPLSAGGRQTLVNAVGQSGAGTILCDAYGGAISRVAPDATAFVHRHELFCMQYLIYNGNDAWLAAAHAAMQPYVSGQAYQNYIDPGLSGWQHAYYGANYARLLATRGRVDPHHVFNFPQAIGR